MRHRSSHDPGTAPSPPPGLLPPPSAALRPGDSERPDRETAIVAALRRIVRAVDLHSRALVEACGLTGPQLAVLREVERAGVLTPAAVAERVHLSRATVTGILARLEARGLLERRPSPTDRRSAHLLVTDAGASTLERAPSLLQERFRRELSFLADWEQLQVLATLERIAAMMDAEHLDAAPHLVAREDELSAPRPPDGAERRTETPDLP